MQLVAPLQESLGDNAKGVPDDVEALLEAAGPSRYDHQAGRMLIERTAAKITGRLDELFIQLVHVHVVLSAAAFAPGFLVLTEFAVKGRLVLARTFRAITH